MRARLSSAEMGLASAVKDLSSAADAAREFAPAIRGALGAACRKTRLDSMLILFSMADSKLAPRGVSLRKNSLQEYCNSQQPRRRNGNMPGGFNQDVSMTEIYKLYGR